jgi:hypothetical protein
LFLMLYKAALSRSRKLGFAGVRADMKRMFRRNGFGFLLSGLS